MGKKKEYKIVKNYKLIDLLKFLAFPLDSIVTLFLVLPILLLLSKVFFETKLKVVLGKL